MTGSKPIDERTLSLLEGQLMRHESYVPHVYRDSKGFWTIGIGRLVDQAKGGGISRSEAMYLLRNDISDRVGELAYKLPWALDLDPVRQIALLNLAFQLGIGGLLKFTRTLDAMKDHRFTDAAAHLLDSKLAREDSPERAKEEAEMIATGVMR